MNCRHCQIPLEHVFLDLGYAPPSNAYLDEADLNAPELTFPLKTYVCHECRLVQTADYTKAEELFRPDYAYFSSTSSSWLAHARDYTAMICERLDLGAESLVVEVASNDGYLLRNFVQRGIPCLGIEPTTATAMAAEALGIPVLREFFGLALGQRLAAEGRRADLIAGNNVLAHVPDINDFCRGLTVLLAPGGTVTLEFPHLLRLIESCQFDTVYHEHFSYLSLTTVRRILAEAELRVLDVEELPTHGGSLRVFAGHEEDARPTAAAVETVIEAEKSAGLQGPEVYAAFQARADAVKNAFVRFLLDEKAAGRTVMAYGAAAKGNTLLNYAGIRPDLLAAVCDVAASKQGRYLPGSHLPIVAPEVLYEARPDTVVILPWNIADEIIGLHGAIADWGGRFAVAVPELRIIEPARN